MREVLVDGRRYQARMWRHNPRDVQRMDHHFGAEERCIELKQARMVREVMQALQLLRITVDRSARADIEAHLFIRHTANSRHIDDTGHLVVASVEPTMAVEYAKHIGADRHHIVRRQEALEEQVAVCNSALAQLFGLIE